MRTTRAEHTRLRALVNRSFTATTVAGMRGRIHSLVRELLQPHGMVRLLTSFRTSRVPSLPW